MKYDFPLPEEIKKCENEDIEHKIKTFDQIKDLYELWIIQM